MEDTTIVKQHYAYMFRVDLSCNETSKLQIEEWLDKYSFTHYLGNHEIGTETKKHHYQMIVWREHKFTIREQTACRNWWRNKTNSQTHGSRNRLQSHNHNRPSSSSLKSRNRIFSSHYTVIGSKIKVSFENDVDAVNEAGQYCFLMLDDTANVPGSLIDLTEESNRTKLAYKQRSSVSSRNLSLSKNFSPYKMFGIPKKDSLINNVNLNAQVTQNPAEDACFTFGIMCSRTTSTNPPPIVCRVEIEYLAVFTEKRPMTSS